MEQATDTTYARASASVRPKIRRSVFLNCTGRFVYFTVACNSHIRKCQTTIYTSNAGCWPHWSLDRATCAPLKPSTAAKVQFGTQIMETQAFEHRSVPQRTEWLIRCNGIGVMWIRNFIAVRACVSASAVFVGTSRIVFVLQHVSAFDFRHGLYTVCVCVRVG